MRAKREQCQVYRFVEGGFDDLGQPETTVTVAGAVNVLVAPGSPAELGSGVEGWRVDYTLYSRAPVDVLESDEIMVRGKRLRVVGKPQKWVTGYGGEGGTVIQVGGVIG